jgi:hypothetical protein
MIVRCLYVADWWSGPDGEPFVGDQDFFNPQDLQESFDQGKYSRTILVSYSPLPLKIHVHVSFATLFSIT